MPDKHPNEGAITRFYTSFTKLDADGMLAEYHPEVRFSDPVFPDLQGPRAGGMWRMLVKRAKAMTPPFRVEFRDVEADATMGRAHWEAHYTFSVTGRPIHNVIEARFTFRDGKIVDHRDTFDLWRWAGMALGLKGQLLGWAPFVQGAIRKTAQKGLDEFMASDAA